ncbi:MAG: hypothetical protein WBB00_19565 [Mycobacterium sp.]
MTSAPADRRIVGADVVEVVQAQLAGIAAVHVAYELISATAPREGHDA